MNKTLIISKPTTSSSKGKHYVVMASESDGNHVVFIEGIPFSVSVIAITDEYEEAVTVVTNLES